MRRCSRYRQSDQHIRDGDSRVRRGEGRCAAGTSTGGLMTKMMGRIGDSPLIGAGTYASELCGVSCTGEGEAIIRSTLARDVLDVMEYKGLELQEAVDYVIKHRLDEGFAGLIAVSSKGCWI